MKLSIVSTMYRSSPFLEIFYQRASAAAWKFADDDFEIILVNDGSPDDSLARATGLSIEDPRVVVVNLSRNFGHHAAIVAGLSEAAGDLIFLIDCDLEEDPEWLDEFAAHMQQTRADVVYGVQQERTGSVWSNLFGELFWRALNAFSPVRIGHNPMTCRLMSRSYVDALLSVEDRVLYLAGVFAWTGFHQEALARIKSPRPVRQASSYNITRKMMQVADSFSSFSVAPLTMIFLLGLAIWLGSIGYGVALLIHKLIAPETVLSGFASVMLSIWFLSGTMILILGILGMYVAKIFQEVKRRPLYIVKNVIRSSSDEPGA
ncbi:glycosyltransferase family 2 protein [Cupriavidus pauculus]|uniref:glycosyltransferase family 2 protein n=1 Tax=Cupriavidus pauculus TaxID=82633 RepID=UPI001C933709|nr:glycosyltransferase family 2 protein [Cupriavidus pauculus]MBY4731293.1 glycosyltransferase family 2 protein [Cupriavidus pauculus]